MAVSGAKEQETETLLVAAVHDSRQRLLESEATGRAIVSVVEAVSTVLR